MSEFWYNALGGAKHRDHHPGPDEHPAHLPLNVLAAPDTAEVPGELGETFGGPDIDDLAALVRIQSCELQRLARENERLMDRIDALLRNQKREHELRQQLQAQVDGLSEQVESAAPAVDTAAISQSVRDEVTADLKPILVALVELLEFAMPTGETGPDREPTRPGKGVAPTMDYRKLPDILTQPLEDLANKGDDEDHVGKRAAGILKRAVSSLGDEPKRPVPIRPDSFHWSNIYS